MGPARPATVGAHRREPGEGAASDACSMRNGVAPVALYPRQLPCRLRSLWMTPLYLVHVRHGLCRIHVASLALLREAVRDKVERLPDTSAEGLAAYRARKRLAADPGNLALPYPMPDHFVVRAIRDLVSAPAGTPSVGLAHLKLLAPEPGQALALEKAWKNEFALWAFRAFEGRPPGACWTCEQLNRARPQDSLSFFSGLRRRARHHPVQYFPLQDVQTAARLHSWLQPVSGPCEGRIALIAALRPMVHWLNSVSGTDEGYLLGEEAIDLSKAGADEYAGASFGEGAIPGTLVDTDSPGARHGG